MANITRVGEGKVVLISGGGKIYTDIAARFCKSQRSLDEILASNYDKNIVKNILDSGHLAATEFDYFLFGVEGYSRVTETQLVRKRMASYLISSGRTETHGKRKFDVVLPEEESLWKEIVGEITLAQENNPVPINIQLNYLQILEVLESWYNNAVANGIPEEQARYMKPQATMFKAILGFNSHALLDWFKIRCCRNAGFEIQDLANKMLKLCKQVAPDLFAKAGASCVSLGYCPEKWQCQKFKGKIPTHQDVLEMIHNWK
jgi:thymidylate synthase (FAD)